MDNLVSIIIPVYNVDKYLDECLNSILNQTYKNLQLIIIDDGSTDNSTKIIEIYEKKFSNMIFLRQQNKGVSVARNLGIQYITGDYVLFIDSDDFLEAHMIEKMVRKIKDENSDIAICGYKTYFGENMRENKCVNLQVEKNKRYTNIDVINMMLEYKIRGFLWNKLFSRKLINSNFKFDEGRYIEDWYPVFESIYCSKEISFIVEPLYNYRQRSESCLHRLTSKKIDDYLYAINKIYRHINNGSIKINSNIISIFNIQNKYNIISQFYNVYKKKYVNAKIYSEFNKSKYNVIKIKFNEFIYCFFKKPMLAIKLLLWDIKIYHFISRFKY